MFPLSSPEMTALALSSSVMLPLAPGEPKEAATTGAEAASLRGADSCDVSLSDGSSSSDADDGSEVARRCRGDQAEAAAARMSKAP